LAHPGVSLPVDGASREPEWLVRYRNRAGRTFIARGDTALVRRRLENGTLPTDAVARRAGEKAVRPPARPDDFVDLACLERPPTRPRAPAPPRPPPLPPRPSSSACWAGPCSWRAWCCSWSAGCSAPERRSRNFVVPTRV